LQLDFVADTQQAILIVDFTGQSCHRCELDYDQVEPFS
jgi:hypothetical protein